MRAPVTAAPINRAVISTSGSSGIVPAKVRAHHRRFLRVAACGWGGLTVA
jgi:hypothetical protein